MKRVFKKLRKINYRHYICILITVGFILCSIFCFPYALRRLAESFKDFGLSIAYYFTELLGFDVGINVTVNDFSKLPFEMPFGLPETWEEFKVLWSAYWDKVFTVDNLKSYFNYLGDKAYYIAMALLLLLPLIILFVFLFRRYFDKQNNDYNKDTKALIRFKHFISKVVLPVKNWILSFFDFIKNNKRYYQIWLFIWAFNFNVISIFVEFLAFYFYFVLSFDFLSIYRQVLKLLMDLAPMLDFVPVFIWAIVGYVVLRIVRKKIGFQRLQHMERKNCGFINERPILSFICGTMGKKKTTMLTDIALSEEVLLRRKAFELILECDLKFPNFPWINLENHLKKAISNHWVYNLATIKKHFNHLFFLWSVQTDDVMLLKAVKRRLKKFGLDYDKPFFDYDFERYDFYYNDCLKMVELPEVLIDYAKLYFIYVVESSLIISNYSVRSDNIKEDLGNFPFWNFDFFSRDVRYQNAYSRHAKIIDFDMFRLGKKVLPDNPKSNFFEFGVVSVTEIGKERKNSLTLLETKVKELLANQKNDGFNDSLKMIRHSATVCNFPFVKIITDEQRPESWGADARDLCEIIHIKESSETRLAMPFFSLYELFHAFLAKRFNDIYYRYRFNRSDNTLFMYLIKNVFSFFHNYYVRTYNTFGYCALNVGVEAGTQDGELNAKRYYMMHKKVYSNRFSTDCFSDYYFQRALRSEIGLLDLEEYADVKASIEELNLQNSYFIQDLNNKHDIDKE